MQTPDEIKQLIEVKLRSLIENEDSVNMLEYAKVHELIDQYEKSDVPELQYNYINATDINQDFDEYISPKINDISRFMHKIFHSYKDPFKHHIVWLSVSFRNYSLIKLLIKKRDKEFDYNYCPNSSDHEKLPSIASMLARFEKVELLDQIATTYPNFYFDCTSVMNLEYVIILAVLTDKFAILSKINNLEEHLNKHVTDEIKGAVYFNPTSPCTKSISLLSACFCFNSKPSSETLEKLIRNFKYLQFDTEHVNGIKMTPTLWVMIYLRLWPQLKLIISLKNNLNINFSPSTGEHAGETLLLSAAFNDQWGLVELILDRYHKTLNINATAQCDQLQGRTVLYYAVKANQFAIAMKILAYFANADLNPIVFHNGELTPLCTLLITPNAQQHPHIRSMTKMFLLCGLQSNDIIHNFCLKLVNNQFSSTVKTFLDESEGSNFKVFPREVRCHIALMALYDLDPDLKHIDERILNRKLSEFQKNMYQNQLASLASLILQRFCQNNRQENSPSFLFKTKKDLATAKECIIECLLQSKINLSEIVHNIDLRNILIELIGMKQDGNSPELTKAHCETAIEAFILSQLSAIELTENNVAQNSERSLVQLN